MRSSSPASTPHRNNAHEGDWDQLVLDASTPAWWPPRRSSPVPSWACRRSWRRAPPSILVDLIAALVYVVTLSFAALVTNCLYLDLRARPRAAPAEDEPAADPSAA